MSDNIERIGLYFTSSIPIKDEILYARLADRYGFNSIWQGESRTYRDSTISIAALATVTERIKLGTGVLHTWTRNVVTLATTFTTLDELTGGRACLGIGALWEPMASKIGVVRRKPLQAMREYVTVLKKLFRGEEVNFQGEFVRVQGVKLERVPERVPVYVGATGFKMMELAGEIADGVLLNYLVSHEYNRKALEHIAAGARRSGRSLDQIDRPQLLAVAYSHDVEKAYSKARLMVAEYLAMEPHIATASGVPEKITEEIRALTGGWPTTAEKLAEAAEFVPDALVSKLMAVGDLETCRKAIAEYVRAGCTEPLLYPVTSEVLPLIHHFAVR
ncbi:MAG: LLM class flavin-dependent oxidoreductase [Candidatus Caldarchaeum sp.]|uniref:LLM class flavin-dependent oxidoreductase n=1 Tax=Caldiarchaeum subterraneum TaxID=311458 RepID=A0A7C5QEB6_CALS0